MVTVQAGCKGKIRDGGMQRLRVLPVASRPAMRGEVPGHDDSRSECPYFTAAGLLQ
jgi:hypothetical protein